MLDIPIKLPHITTSYSSTLWIWVDHSRSRSHRLRFDICAPQLHLRNLASSNQKRIDVTTTVGEKSTKHGSEDSEGSTV